MMLKRTVLISAALCALPALAADAVTDAMQKAYSPYRVALFKTNSNSPSEARQAIDQARLSWNRLSQEFGAKAPAPYDRDVKFVASLAAVSKIYDKAAVEIGQNQLGQAHETLEEARDVMAELRRRNGVIVFSDHMNAYHAQMEAVLSDGARLSDTSLGLLELIAQTGALEYLAKQLVSQAPSELASNAEFKPLLDAVQRSVLDLRAALFTQDKDKVKEALGKVKSPYSKLFLKFG